MAQSSKKMTKGRADQLIRTFGTYLDSTLSKCRMKEHYPYMMAVEVSMRFVEHYGVFFTKKLYEDNEYALYTVTLFNRVADNFRTSAREKGSQRVQLWDTYNGEERNIVT